MIASSNYDEAIRVMQCAAAVPKNTKINYHDHVRFLFSCHVINLFPIMSPTSRSFRLKPASSSRLSSGPFT